MSPVVAENVHSTYQLNALSSYYKFLILHANKLNFERYLSKRKCLMNKLFKMIFFPSIQPVIVYGRKAV